MAAKEAESAQALSGGSKDKKGKFKGKTVDLNELLSDRPGAINWADAVEQESLNQANTTRIELKAKIIQKRQELPTAPRALRDPAADTVRIGPNPPWVAYVGNMPFNALERDVEEFFFKHEVRVEKVHVAKDSSGEYKGYGYVLFSERQHLIKALGLTTEDFNNRPIKIDLTSPEQLIDIATKRLHWKPDGDTEGGNWRAAGARQYAPNRNNQAQQQFPENRDDRQSQNYAGGQHGAVYQPPKREYSGDQRQLQYQNSGRTQNGGGPGYGSQYHQQQGGRHDYGENSSGTRGNYNQYGPPRGGGTPYNTRSLPRPPRGYPANRGGPQHYEAEFDHRMQGGQFPPHFHAPQDNYGRYPDGYDHLQHQAQGGYGGGGGYGGYPQYQNQGHYGRGYGDRYHQQDYGRYPQYEGYYDEGYNNANYGAGRTRGGNYPQHQGYERRGYQGGGGGYGRQRREPYIDQHDHRGDEAPRTRLESTTSITSEAGSEAERAKERKRLELKPRTKPIGSVEEETEVGKARQSIFGGAKPVDTTEREKAIEERILKEREELHKQAEEAKAEKLEKLGRRSRTISQISATSGAENDHSALTGPVRILTRSRSSVSERSVGEKESESKENDLSVDSETTLKDGDGGRKTIPSERVDVTEQKLRPERSGTMPANNRRGEFVRGGGGRNRGMGDRDYRGDRDNRPFRDDGRSSQRGGRGRPRDGPDGRVPYEGPPRGAGNGPRFFYGANQQRPPRYLRGGGSGNQRGGRDNRGGGRGQGSRQAAGKDRVYKDGDGSVSPTENGGGYGVETEGKGMLKMEEDKPVNFSSKNPFDLLGEDAEE